MSKMIRKIFTSIQKNGLSGFLLAALRDIEAGAAKKLAYYKNHRTKFIFSNRQSGKKDLAIVLAGYKSYLWPATLARIKRHAPDHIDICIASPGIKSSELEKICMQHDGRIYRLREIHLESH